MGTGPGPSADLAAHGDQRPLVDGAPDRDDVGGIGGEGRDPVYQGSTWRSATMTFRGRSASLRMYQPYHASP